MKHSKMILCAVAALLSLDVAAADKCKFKQDTSDYFTGVPTTRTPWTEIYAAGCTKNCPGRGTLSAVSDSGNRWLEFDVKFSNSSVFVPLQTDLDNALIVPATASLEVTLSDGSTVALPVIEPVTAWTKITYPYEQGNDNYITWAYARLRFTIDATAMDTLGARDASSISIVGTNKTIDTSLGKKSRSYFKDSVNCLKEGEAS